MAIQDDEASLLMFMKQGGWEFPVALMPDNVANDYGIDAIPTIVVIDANGRIVKTFVGGASADELSALIDDLTG